MSIRRIVIAAAVLAAVATSLTTGVASAAPSGYRSATATGSSQSAAENNAHQALLNRFYSYCGQPTYSDTALAPDNWSSTARAYCIG